MTEQWDLAGITTMAGGTDRPLPSGLLYPPAGITIETLGGEECLAWSDPERFPKGVKPGPEILDQFLRLSNAPSHQVLSFARQWGVLGLCEHGLPHTHAEWPSGRRPNCPPLQIGDLHVEPIPQWRRFSHDARLLLEIAAELHQGRVGKPEHWGSLYADSPAGKPAPWWKQSIVVDRGQLANALNEWLLRLADVKPFVQWTGDRPEIFLGGGASGLFGLIATRLVLAAAATEGFAICTSCGRPYIPARRPSEGKRRYCDDCREAGRSVRDAARDYKRRQRG